MNSHNNPNILTKTSSSKSSVKNSKAPTIFLLAGRTGGPLSPYPAIIKELKIQFPDLRPIVFGVKNGYEQVFCEKNNLELFFLPQAKLDILSFGNNKTSSPCQGVGGYMTRLNNFVTQTLQLIILSFKLIYSFFICIYYIIKFQPKFIISTGSFLAIPMLFGAKILKILRLTKTKVVIHQLDPKPGLSNRICVKLSDLTTCIFEYTKKKYPDFYNAKIIPNPLLIDKFQTSNNFQNQELQIFWNLPLSGGRGVQSNSNQKLPTLLIFGGGSGALAINDWVYNNLESLVSKYRIIHLIGILQDNGTNEIKLKPSPIRGLRGTTNYLSLPALYEDMPSLLASVDYIIARSGVGTISELQFLSKKAFLVPIPDTHQELNAELVQSQFIILDQNKTSQWLDIIDQSITQNLWQKKENSYDQKSLEEYYRELKKLVR